MGRRLSVVLAKNARGVPAAEERASSSGCGQLPTCGQLVRQDAAAVLVAEPLEDADESDFELLADELSLEELESLDEDDAADLAGPADLESERESVR